MDEAIRREIHKLAEVFAKVREVETGYICVFHQSDGGIKNGKEGGREGEREGGREGRREGGRE